MEAKRKVFCTFRVPGLHFWSGAFGEGKYLHAPHRHIFHYRVEIGVGETDREIEFIGFKHDLQNWVYEVYAPGPHGGDVDFEERSCEILAEELLDYIMDIHPGRCVLVEVSEDGENGAIIRS